MKNEDIICFGAKNLSVEFEQKRVITDFDIAFGGGITAILGASGCGKTTLLRTLAGLQKPQNGKVFGLDGRKIAFVFAEPRLLPWYNVIRNIQAVNPKLSEEKLREILTLTETDSFTELLPSELSAGMAQRVSLARALAFCGDVLFMDEPFKAMDEELKKRIMTRLRAYAKEIPVVFITHYPDEAEAFADRIVTLSGAPLKVADDRKNVRFD